MNLDETEPVPEPGAEPAKDPVKLGANIPEPDPESAEGPVELSAGVSEREPEPVTDTAEPSAGVSEFASEPPNEPVEADSAVPALEPGPVNEQADLNAVDATFEGAPAVAESAPAPWVEVPRRELHIFRTMAACVAGALIPGLGHAVLGKWDRAIVFLGTISAMFAFGLYLNGRLFSPDFSDLFSSLKFIADAGIGLIYWLSWHRGLGVGDPAAYTYDFANVFIYVAGLLNMLVIVDAFDIAQERKP